MFPNIFPNTVMRNDVYLETPSLFLKSVGKSALNMGKVGVLEGNVIMWVSLQ